MKSMSTKQTNQTPIAEMTGADLRKILLTADGRGSEIKERCLNELLNREWSSGRASINYNP